MFVGILVSRYSAAGERFMIYFDCDTMNFNEVNGNCFDIREYQEINKKMTDEYCVLNAQI